jgi:D-citramalate synthase
MNKKQRPIEIMDTTLRDGEQTSGVSFTAPEKLTVAQLLLEELQVDRIEIASARVSKGEQEAVNRITSWAYDKGLLDRVEVLTFVDQGVSLDWMEASGAKVQNLLTKGSLNHLTHQLKQTPEQHFKNVAENLQEAQKRGIRSNVYLEDWSNGMRNSKDYVFDYLDHLVKQPVERILLPDTLGVLTPDETSSYLREILSRYPGVRFDFHGHNDYDLGVANVLEAVKAGVNGLHLTVNGMGERAGNAALASSIAVINDFVPEVKTRVKEKALYKVSQLVATFSGFHIPVNKPVVGANVFTQTAGIHADGDAKNNLYFNDLLPERFGRKRSYALGKTSGKANILKNLNSLGISLGEEELKKVTAQVIALGDKKQKVTLDDLPYIISDVLGESAYAQHVKIESYVLTHAKGLQPSTTVSVRIAGELYEENACGDGQYDAFLNAIRKIYKQLSRELPQLIDYFVHIPPGSHSDALCETTITWKTATREFITRGLDSDQTVSAIKATEKMLNQIYTA